MFHALRTDTLFMRIKRIDLSNCVFHIVNGITRLDIERNGLHATTQTKYQIQHADLLKRCHVPRRFQILLHHEGYHVVADDN